MGFSATWLALREPADRAARDAALLAAAATAAGTKPVIVDLGCGTGSTIRAFQNHLKGPAEWRLVDNDADLLAQAADAAEGDVSTHKLDLRDLDSLPLEGASLVTASALFDLCSRAWIDDLAAELARRKLPIYAALTYDGTMQWWPSDAVDADVTLAFNRHQRGDKGFGPALGPDAARIIAAAFGAVGYRVLQADSPWQLGPPQIRLQQELLAGISDAASEAGEGKAESWRARRVAMIDRAQCRIGHFDLLALPSGGDPN